MLNKRHVLKEQENSNQIGSYLSGEKLRGGARSCPPLFNKRPGIVTAVSKNGTVLLRRLSPFSVTQSSHRIGNRAVNPSRVIRVFQLTGFLFSVCHSSAVFSAIPYEVCSEKNQTWTDRFIAQISDPSDEETEAGYCEGGNCRPGDQKFQAIQGAYDEVFHQGKKGGAGDIPALCFYGSMLRNKKEPRVYNCSESTSEFPLSASDSDGARPCFNEDYVTATAKAFNEVTDCFDFSKKEKDRFFALLNHESSFILNAKSRTNARCFGQLTLNNIKATNTAIYFRERDAYKERRNGRIYKSAVQKCPELESKVIPPEIATVKAQTASDRKKEETTLSGMNRRASFTCGVTHDPVSCLFYSAYSMRMSELDFDENYDEEPDYMGHRDPSEREQRDFLFPVRLNEVLVVQGEITRKATGKKEAKDFVFWDSSEMHDFAKKITYKREDLKIKKVPLFDKEVLEASFLYYAHNGGRSLVRSHLTRFVEDLKKKIAKGSWCNKNKACSKYRASLMAGRSLSFADLREEFEKYAKKAELTNRAELVKFTEKIDEGMKFLHNTDEKYPDEIKRKVMDFSKSEDSAAADQFINDVKEQCPASPF